MEGKLNKEKFNEEINYILNTNSSCLDEFNYNKQTCETKVEPVSNIVKCQTTFGVILDKIDVELKDDKIGEQEYVTLYVDGVKIKYLFSMDVITEKNIIKYRKILKGIILNQFPTKKYSKKECEWSYINEENECQTITDQKEYNKGLLSQIDSSCNSIIVNSKLKPLFETLSNKDGEILHTYMDKDGVSVIYLKITYVDSDKDENIIYCYNSKSLDSEEKIITLNDLETISELFGNTETVKPVYSYIEITNIDNGIFGIKNDKIRVKNNRQLILVINNEADLDYISGLINFNYSFSGISHIDFKNPEKKYSYFSKMLASLKESIEDDKNDKTTTNNDSETDCCETILIEKDEIDSSLPKTILDSITNTDNLKDK